MWNKRAAESHGPGSRGLSFGFDCGDRFADARVQHVFWVRICTTISRGSCSNTSNPFARNSKSTQVTNCSKSISRSGNSSELARNGMLDC